MTDKLPPTILVVEPNPLLNSNICNSIERYWFNVTRATDLKEALQSIKFCPPNIAMISSRIQDLSAIEMAVHLRKHIKYNLPIIFLTEKDEKIANYNLIGDNMISVLSRPFDVDELMKLVRSILRQSKPIFQDKVLVAQDIRMDLATYKVYRQNKEMYLGPTEFKILQLFVQKPKHVYSRDQIIESIWGVDHNISHRTIDVHINRIRKIMKLPSDRYPLINTIRAAGYCLD